MDGTPPLSDTAPDDDDIPDTESPFASGSTRQAVLDSQTDQPHGEVTGGPRSEMTDELAAEGEEGEAPGDTYSPAPVRIESIRCRGFRGLADMEIALNPTVTVIVGRNNSGKSRVLRALALAVGAVPADKDDLTVGGGGIATIDLVLAPAVSEGVQKFDARVATALAQGARQTVSEHPLRERAGWQTTIRRSSEGFSAHTQRRLLRWDNATGSWGPTPGEPSRELLRLVRGDLIEARRDLAHELLQRGSAANRLIDDLEIDPGVAPELQQQLDELSAAIVAGSSTLRDVKAALQELASRVDAVGQPQVRPVPGRLSDLSSVASIEVADDQGQDLPLRLHGTGARSLASLRLQGVLYERRLGADGGDLRPHPVTMVEEPEAHLHPQAQFDLRELLESIPGQVIASTHSTHLVTEMEHEHVRILRPRSDGTSIVSFVVVDDPDDGTLRQLRPELYASEMEKLRRGVERPFGELLFSSVVVVGDGATERALLPPLIRHALGPIARGLCVIDPGSMGDPAAVGVLKAARLLDIPWFLFADSDEDGKAAVQSLLDLLSAEEEHAQLRADCVIEVGGDGATEQMLAGFDEELCREAARRTRPDIDTTDVVKALKKLKGSAGRFLASEMIKRYDDPLTWPAPLQSLIEAIRSAMGTTPDDDPGEDHDVTPAQL